MSGTIHIRQMELDDLSSVFRLGERLFTSERWPTLYRTWEEFELITFFASDGDTCFVAERDGEIVGFTMGTTLTKRRSAWMYGWIVWLGVAPEVARQGVGKRLVERITEAFVQEGARMLLIDTDAENEAAIAFFTQMGFGDPVDHVYFTRNLWTEFNPRKKPRRRTEEQEAVARTRRRAGPPPPILAGKAPKAKKKRRATRR